MSLANLILAVSLLKIHSCKYFESSDVIIAKRKSLWKVYYVLSSSFLVYSTFSPGQFYPADFRKKDYFFGPKLQLMLKKDEMVSSGAPRCTNRADKNSNIIRLVTIIIMLL